MSEEDKKISDVVIIKMDPESPEWKARINKLKNDIANKNDGEEHEYDSFGYRNK